MEIKIKHQPSSQRIRQRVHWLHKLFVLLVYLTIALTSLELISTTKSAYFVALGVGLLYLIIKKSKRIVYILVGLGIFSIILLNKYMMTGFFLFMNKISELIGIKTNIFLSTYEITESLEHIGVILFSFVLFGLLIILLDTIIGGHKPVYLLGLLTFFLLVQLIYSESIWAIIPLVLMMFVLLNYHLQPKGNRGVIPFITTLILIVVSLSIIGISNLVWSSHVYEKPAFAMKVEAFITNKFEQLLYEKSKPNGISHDFTQLKELKLTDEEDLEVIMEKPDSYYLRGFIGAEYTRSKWQELDYEKRYANYGLFHELEKQAFEPLKQLSLVREIGLESEEELDFNEITIQNKSASSKYYYTPYELTNEDIDTYEFKEFRLLPNKFFGDRNYQLTASSDLVTYYPQIANRIYKNKDKVKAISNYLEKEAYYNAYVYENYTELPEEVIDLLDMYIGREELDDKNEHPPYEQAIEWVDDYLDKTLTYTEEPKVLPYHQDFISFLIKESEEGYAPHYATAATLILRYLGIPARYVEGYLITPEHIKDKEAYEKISIKNKDNHAWTEIYFDQIGWLPIEFTPAYKDKMRETDLTDYPKGEWSEEEKQREIEKLKEEIENPLPDPPETEDIEESELQDESNEEDSEDSAGEQDDATQDDQGNSTANVDDLEDDPNIVYLSLWILLFILLLLLLLYLIYFIKKRLQLRKIRQAFVGDDLKEAITMLTSYSLMLIHISGIKEKAGSLKGYKKDINALFGSEIADRYIELVTLNQAVIYGKKEPTEAERMTQLQFKDELLSLVLQNKTFLEKLRMRMIDFVY